MQDFLDDAGRQLEIYGPPIIKALLVLLAFYIAARFVGWLIKEAVNRTGFAARANKQTAEGEDLGGNLGQAGFWLVMLFGIVQALDVLDARRISDALNEVIDPIVAYLPNIVGAIIVFALFLILANVVKQALMAILVFVNDLPKRAGVTDNPVPVASVAAYTAYGLLVLIGATVALDVLNIDAISRPAGELLEQIILFIPRIVVAGIILAIFVAVARFIGTIGMRILPALGIDGAARELGLLRGADAGMTASSVVLKVAQFFIILVGLVTAVNVLAIPALTEAVETVLAIGASILFGAVIIFAGIFAARLVHDALASTGEGANDAAADVIKYVIIGLAVILGISRMGLDPSPDSSFVLDAARILLLGAAIAMALAFGLGGRDWAGEQLRRLTRAGEKAAANAGGPEGTGIKVKPAEAAAAMRPAQKPKPKPPADDAVVVKTVVEPTPTPAPAPEIDIESGTSGGTTPSAAKPPRRRRPRRPSKPSEDS